MQTRNVPRPNFDKEIAYFKEVDSFELLEESPSPKKPSTWIMGVPTENVVLPHLSSVLQKWLIAQKRGCGPPPSLARILETPATRKRSMFSTFKTSGEVSFQIRPSCHSVRNRIDFSAVSEDVSVKINNTGCEDIRLEIGELSLISSPASIDDQSWDPLVALLTACAQSAPSKFSDVLLTYW